jgi:quercetin dioxygenase-like cupin family protein
VVLYGQEVDRELIRSDASREGRKETHMKRIRVAAVVAFAVAGVIAVQVIQAQQSGAKRTELQRHDLSMPGREVIQVRVDLDPGHVFPSHTHPGEEIIYVIEGTWEYEIGGTPVTAKAGDVFFVPAGTIHSAKNAGTGNAAELATYVVEKGQPLLTLVK